MASSAGLWQRSPGRSAFSVSSRDVSSEQTVAVRSGKRTPPSGLRNYCYPGRRQPFRLSANSRFALSTELQTSSGPTPVDSSIADDQADPGARDLRIGQIDVLPDQPRALAMCIDQPSAHAIVPVEQEKKRRSPAAFTSACPCFHLFGASPAMVGSAPPFHRLDQLPSIASY